MRLMSSTCWEGIFTTIRNLFYIFMFYILKSTYLYRIRGYYYFFKIIIFFIPILHLISPWFRFYNFNASLYICASGESDSEANDACTNYILAVVFQTRVVRDKWWEWFICITSTNMLVFVRVWEQFIRIATGTCECLCKWRDEAQTRMCKSSVKFLLSNILEITFEIPQIFCRLFQI